MSFKSVVFLLPGVLVSAIAGAVIFTVVVEIQDQNNENQLISPEVGLFNLLNNGELPKGTTGQIKNEAFSKILPQKHFEHLSDENKVKVGKQIPSIIDLLSIEALYAYVGDNGLKIARPGDSGDSSVGILTINFKMGIKQELTNINIPFPKSKLMEIASATLKHKPGKNKNKNNTKVVEIWDEGFNLHSVEFKQGSKTLTSQDNATRVRPRKILADLKYLHQIYKKIKQRIESKGDRCHPDSAGVLWELTD